MSWKRWLLEVQLTAPLRLLHRRMSETVDERVDLLSARRHVCVGGDGRYCPDRSVGLPETDQWSHSRGTQQETSQQGLLSNAKCIYTIYLSVWYCDASAQLCLLLRWSTTWACASACMTSLNWRIPTYSRETELLTPKVWWKQTTILMTELVLKVWGFSWMFIQSDLGLSYLSYLNIFSCAPKTLLIFFTTFCYISTFCESFYSLKSNCSGCVGRLLFISICVPEFVYYYNMYFFLSLLCSNLVFF